MPYHLFLDDERHLSDVTWIELPSKITNNWTTVRNYQEFVNTILSFGIPEFISFDHDLADEHYAVMLKEVEASRYTSFVDDEHGGLTITFDYGKEKTGFDCAKWLVDFCIERGVAFPEYRVHSMNPIGKERIIGYIENARAKANI